MEGVGRELKGSGNVIGSLCVWLLLYIYISIHTYIYVCMYVYVHLCMSICINMFMYARTIINIQTNIHKIPVRVSFGLHMCAFILKIELMNHKQKRKLSSYIITCLQQRLECPLP